MRKSYHGYSNGYAQLLQSPVTFSIQPMQIDTHNRNWTGTTFKAGPLPKAATAPAGAPYSGLLECPCTDRIVKQWSVNYIVLSQGNCKTAVATADECAQAALSVGAVSKLTPATVVSNASEPAGCYVVAVPDEPTGVFFNTLTSSPATCGSGAQASTGNATVAASGVGVAVILKGGMAYLTLTGPASVWFGAAFDATHMADLPYAIIVNGTGTAVWEQRLGNHEPGHTLNTQSLTILSNTVVNGVKTVKLVRPMQGATTEHYTFSQDNLSINILGAIGSVPTFSYHAARGGAVLNLLPVGAAACVCNNGITGTINGVTFSKNCLDEPAGDLIQQQNPTCFVQTYQGGLSCCFHKSLLLDKDQNPWPDKLDTYRLKFRYNIVCSVLCCGVLCCYNNNNF